MENTPYTIQSDSSTCQQVEIKYSMFFNFVFLGLLIAKMLFTPVELWFQCEVVLR